MANFPGAKAYPLLTDRTTMLDVGTLTKMREVTIERGGTAADFNAHLRGAFVRIDRVPDPPYPP